MLDRVCLVELGDDELLRRHGSRGVHRRAAGCGWYSYSIGPIGMLMWIAFLIGLIACGMLAANERVRFAWVVVLVLALIGFRLTQSVTQYGVEGTTAAHQPQ